MPLWNDIRQWNVKISHEKVPQWKRVPHITQTIGNTSYCTSKEDVANARRGTCAINWLTQYFHETTPWDSSLSGLGGIRNRSRSATVALETPVVTSVLKHVQNRPGFRVANGSTGANRLHTRTGESLVAGLADRRFYRAPIIDRMRVVETEDLYTMSNLSPRRTGLPFVVWISPKGGALHDVRVKVSRTRSDHHARSQMIAQLPRRDVSARAQLAIGTVEYA